MFMYTFIPIVGTFIRKKLFNYILSLYLGDWLIIEVQKGV